MHSIARRRPNSAGRNSGQLSPRFRSSRTNFHRNVKSIAGTHLIGCVFASERSEETGMTSRTMTSRLFAAWIAVGVLAAHGPNFAFAQGTEQQREACTPDALRLCGQFIPDAGKVEACLRNAGPKLSPPCRVVFNPPPPSNNQTTPVRERRLREQAPPPPPPAEHDDDD